MIAEGYCSSLFEIECIPLPRQNENTLFALLTFLTGVLFSKGRDRWEGKCFRAPGIQKRVPSRVTINKALFHPHPAKE